MAREGFLLEVLEMGTVPSASCHSQDKDSGILSEFTGPSPLPYTKRRCLEA